MTMKMKNTLSLLLLLGGFAVGYAQEKAPELETTVLKDSLQEKILERLDSIYILQRTIEQQRQAELDSVPNDPLVKRRSDIGVMRDIAKNTKEDFVESGWTLFALLTFFISLIVSLITSWSQWRTERHTKNVSIGSQLGVLDDLPRHFYRNLVCTVAMLIRYRHTDNRNATTDTFKTYPSEANVMKLQTLPEEFILPIDMATDKIFDEMHEQKLLFKNYNIEVASASKHFSYKHIKEKSLVNDYDNLLFKPIFLIARLCDLYEMLKRSKKWSRDEYVCNVICTFVMEHLCKLSFKKISYGMQKNYFRDIEKKENFEKYIKYDMSTQYDKPDCAIYCNGIERSVDFLLGMYKKCNPKCFISKKNGKYVIKSEVFKEYFSAVKNDEIIEKKKEEIVYDVLSFVNVGEIMTKYNLEGMECSDAIKSYLEYWRQEEWDLKELLYNMLKMDAILEFPLIGMIEHKG